MRVKQQPFFFPPAAALWFLPFCWLPLNWATPLQGAESLPPKPSEAVSKLFAGSPPSNIADLAAMETHIQKLVAYVTPFTVGVVLGPSQGSGVIVSADGYVLTAAHVSVRPNRPVVVILPNNVKVKGITLGLQSGLDAGLIKITDEGKWPYAEMGDSSALKPGQWCMGAGHPGGFQADRQPVVRVGRILSNRKQAIVTDSLLVGGDSGGPLFDFQGKVIGVHSRIGGPFTANMHVPINAYRDSWERLVQGEAWGFLSGRGPYLGVTGNIDEEGATLKEVMPGSPAEKAGLKVGDKITELDGKSIDDFGTLIRRIGDRKVGDKIKLKLQRKDQTLELELTLGSRE